MKKWIYKSVACFFVFLLFLNVFSGAMEISAYADGGSTVVYITDTGKCYHSKNCSCLKKSKHEITLEEAVAAGYTACSKCKAPKLTQTSENDSDVSTISKEKKSSDLCEFILNTNTMKFHYADCASVKKIKKANKAVSTQTAAELIAAGYSPCGNCKPN